LDLAEFARPRLVLVDHNELCQAVAGADEAEVVEVIDHHRIGGSLVSREPIRFINEPVGSTSTLVARMAFARGLVPPRSIAVMLCAGIASDTLNLRSPTTTDLIVRCWAAWPQMPIWIWPSIMFFVTSFSYVLLECSSPG
jgi:manganese-dependent inorganic pyrophosphatase